MLGRAAEHGFVALYDAMTRTTRFVKLTHRVEFLLRMKHKIGRPMARVFKRRDPTQEGLSYSQHCLVDEEKGTNASGAVVTYRLEANPALRYIISAIHQGKDLRRLKLQASRMRRWECRQREHEKRDVDSDSETEMTVHHDHDHTQHHSAQAPQEFEDDHDSCVEPRWAPVKEHVRPDPADPWTANLDAALTKLTSSTLDRLLHLDDIVDSESPHSTTTPQGGSK
jgi:hypothetical protein